MTDTDFESYLLKICKEMNIDEKKIIKDWRLYCDESKKEKKKVYNKCIYKFTKSPKMGQECGVSIRKEGSFYCSKHTRYKKVIEDDKQVSDSTELKKIAIRLHPDLKKFVHNTSGLVFFSKSEQVVYGKLINGVILELSDNDIEICKKYQFKYDKSKFISS